VNNKIWEGWLQKAIFSSHFGFVVGNRVGLSYCKCTTQTKNDRLGLLWYSMCKRSNPNAIWLYHVFIWMFEVPPPVWEKSNEKNNLQMIINLSNQYHYVWLQNGHFTSYQSILSTRPKNIPIVLEVATSIYKLFQSRLANHFNPPILVLDSKNIEGYLLRRLELNWCRDLLT